MIPQNEDVESRTSDICDGQKLHREKREKEDEKHMKKASKKGKIFISFYLAWFEIVLHAAMCVILIGWGTGFQYYILAVSLLTFFWPVARNTTKAFMTIGLASVYGALYLAYGDAVPANLLEPWIRDTLYFGNSLGLLFFLSMGSYFYSTAAANAEAALQAEKTKSEEMSILLKKMFGRYLSTEVLNSLIEDPSSLELGGERRSVTIMMSDLRGFTALSERLQPEQVVQMLNAYFEVMVEVISKYNGTINEIIGDALLIIFGAPQEMLDRAQRAIACAIEMQNKMTEVNERNRAQGLPELEMGIGLNEAEVVVGNIGSAKRSKYAAVGSGVNMTSRIESYTVGGQILISESVHREAGNVLRIDDQRDVYPKGSETSIRIYEIGGIAGEFNLALEKKEPSMVTLIQQIPIKCTIPDGKDIGEKGLQGSLIRLSKRCADIELSDPVELLSNLKMNLAGVDENLSGRDFYGKVIKRLGEGEPIHTVRFTAVPPEVDSYFQAFQKHAANQTGI